MKLDFCVACGATGELHFHHLIPKSKGGSDEESNLLTLCHECHAKIHGMREGSWLQHKKLVKEALKKNKKNGKQWTREKYGLNFVDGKVVPNKTEMKHIRKMVKLRDKGLAYEDIATKLEADGFRTRKGTVAHRGWIRRVVMSYKEERKSK